MDDTDFGVDVVDVDEESITTTLECPLPMRNGDTIRPVLVAPETSTTDSGSHHHHHNQHHYRKNPVGGRGVKVLEHSTLRFKDLSFLVGIGSSKPKTRILTNVSDTVHHGHVLAIMGPSGAGKSKNRYSLAEPFF
jgi:ABC-type glutathione transport system ATPase component